MPKFTLMKHADGTNDASVTVTFETDYLGAAQDHFEDFMKAAGFEIALGTKPQVGVHYTIRDPSTWEWDDNGELKGKESATAPNLHLCDS